MAGKKVASPRHHVISGRFSNEENEAFRRIAAGERTTLGNIVRDAMLAWKEQHEKEVKP